MILPPQVGAPARTGAQLGRGDGIGAVVRLQPDDAPALHMGDQQAAPAAVVRGAAHADLRHGLRCFPATRVPPKPEKTHGLSVGRLWQGGVVTEVSYSIYDFRFTIDD